MIFNSKLITIATIVEIIVKIWTVQGIYHPAIYCINSLEKAETNQNN